MEKYYTTHNPIVKQQHLWFVELAVTMEMFTEPANFMFASYSYNWKRSRSENEIMVALW